MPKRSVNYPYRRSKSEQRIDSQRHYGKIEDKPGRINPVFTEPPHYGGLKQKREVV